jgi:hypothetical protein
MQIVNGFSAKTNGSHPEQTSGPAAAGAEGNKKSPFSRSAQGEVVDVILSMHSDLVEHGRERALLSGDIEPREDDLRVLEDHASAMAEQAYREAYDPDKHEDHKLREAEYHKLQKMRDEAELTTSYAVADVADLEKEMSRAQSNMKTPTTPQVLMLSAVAGLALTIAPTLHDYIFITMKDDVLNWTVSLLSAITYGVFITWGLLDSDDAGGRRSIKNWLGLAGGIGVPLGLGMLRIANAIGFAEVFFAIALTVIEIGIVLLLESRAAALRTAYQDWAGQQAFLNNISTRLQSARSQLAQRKEALGITNDAIAKHIRLVEELSVRHFNVEKIKTDAMRAVRDGYYAGISTNRGRTRGIRS